MPSAESFATTCLWLCTLAVPYLFFAASNSFRSRGIIAIRALLSVGVGWCLSVASAVAARAIAVSVASSSGLLKLDDRDGAPLAFSAVLGGMPAALIVCLAWLVHAVLLRNARMRRGT